MSNTEVISVPLRYCDIELVILACRAEARRLERRNRTVIESVLLNGYAQLADAMQKAVERREPDMRRVSLHARGATISFITEELEKFGEALWALIDSKDGCGSFTDDHMESMAALHTRIRTALLLATARDCLSVGAQEHLEKAGLGNLE